MNKLVEAFKNLMRGNKSGFVLLCLRLGVAFVFFIALMFPFFKLIQFGDVVNRVSAVQFPAGWIFLLLTLGLMVGVLYLTVMDNVKLLKIALLVQCIQATALLLWGLILYWALVQEASSYPEASAALGFGFTLSLISIAFLWFVTFGEKILFPLLQKWFPAKPAEQPQVVSEQPTVQ